MSESPDPKGDAGRTGGVVDGTGTGSGAVDAEAASDPVESIRKAPRLDPLAVRRQLRDEGLRARHSLSQNFLADPDVLQAILDLAAPEPGRRVLEVGPGLGILTGGLLAGGAAVTAVELDRQLAGRLGRTNAEAIASGALTLIQAHKALEDLCLEREVLHYKLGVEQKWAELVYNGLWFSPLKEALDGFVDTTQKLVTGDVRLRFFKGSCVVVGRRSPYSLYDYNLATYDAADTFDHKAAKGFIDLWGLPTKVWARQRRKVGKEGEV